MFGAPTTQKYLNNWLPRKSIMRYGYFLINTRKPPNASKDDIHMFLDGKIGGVVDLNTGCKRDGWLFYRYPEPNQADPNHPRPEFHLVKVDKIERYWKKDFSQVLIFCPNITYILTRLIDPYWFMKKEFFKGNIENKSLLQIYFEYFRLFKDNDFSKEINRINGVVDEETKYEHYINYADMSVEDSEEDIDLIEAEMSEAQENTLSEEEEKEQELENKNDMKGGAL